ncbi:MAG: superoxide dismutase family protein [Rhizobiales bacterium]|nr:superoxide dismutase family protein [Hyphomicrobiales bacterium]
MTPIRPALLAFVFAVTALPAVADESATVTVRDTYGQLVTTLTLSDAGNGVLVTGTVSGIDPGPHAIHFHEKGVCEPPFETAGGHFNPTGHQHGILNAEGHHAGDMPNVVMPKEGEGTIQIFAAGVTLARDAEGSLRDGDGTAIVIHAGPDDYKTDPSGDSGGRIACGVVE